MQPAEVLKLAKKHDAKMVDFKFVDLLGHLAAHDDADRAARGEHLRGRLRLRRLLDPRLAADQRLRHDHDPRRGLGAHRSVLRVPTLSLICDIVDPITHQPYPRDPRTIAAKAEAYLKSTGIGDTAYFGPEAEFFVFDEVRYSTSTEPRQLLRSTRPRASGTPTARSRAATSATRSPTRRATSPSRRPTRSPTCASRWP